LNVKIIAGKAAASSNTESQIRSEFDK